MTCTYKNYMIDNTTRMSRITSLVTDTCLKLVRRHYCTTTVGNHWSETDQWNEGRPGKIWYTVLDSCTWDTAREIDYK